MSDRPRLLLLHTGGTLAMLPAGEPGPLAPALLEGDVLRFVAGLEQVAEIEGRSLFNLDSSDMGPAHWRAIARAVAERMGDVDGVVVLHGTDTMAWTACALSFMLENLPCPVVLTGSQRPLAEPRTDARSNLVHAAIAATLDIPEVCIQFGSWLLRGNCATKRSVQSYDAFWSPVVPPLVEMGVDLVPGEPPIRPRGPFRLRDELCEDVALLTAFPGMDPGILRGVLRRRPRVVVLLAFGAGNLPTEGWPEAVAEATEAGVAVVVGTQCDVGRVDLGRYAGGAALARAGAVGAGGLTAECAVVRSMVLAARCRDRQDFVEAWPAPLAGEPIAARPTPATAW